MSTEKIRLERTANLMQIFIAGLFFFAVLMLNGCEKSQPVGPEDDILAKGNDGKIVFTSTRDGNEEIYLMNGDGTGLNRLTNNLVNDFYADLRGKRIAFNSFRDGNVEIYTMNLDGTGVTRLTFTSPSWDVQPRWSPNGKQIVFQRDGDIYKMNADGSNVSQLTFDGAGNEHAIWSSNGNQIIFSSYREGNSKIFVMNADGSGMTRLTNDAPQAWDYDPVVTSNSSKIAFSRHVDGDYEIFIMNYDGTGLTNLTNNTYNDFFPSFSDNDKKIAFTSDRDAGNTEIYSMNIDGTGVTRLTHHPDSDLYVGWGK